MDISEAIKEEVMTFLKTNNTAVLATVMDRLPYASTVHYVIDDDWSIYFLSHRNTSKYLSISAHQRAAVVVGTGPKHISVQAKGIIDICSLEKTKEIQEKFLWLKGSQIIDKMPIEEMKAFSDKNPVAFKFEPLELTFMNLDDEAYPASKGNTYHQILP